MAEIKIAQLLKAGVHFGHKTPRWNPKMFPYIYMERNGIHILDLVQTSQLLQEACDFVQLAAEQGKTFLFVGTKPQAAELIKEEALRADSFYINHRWYGGLLTNWQTVKGRIQTLHTLEAQEETIFPTLPKKESASLRKELTKLRSQLNGVKNMSGVPDIMIVIDQNYELTAVREAIKLNIPIISILDSNCDPDLIDIPIPGNDDAISSIKIILEALTDSIRLGRQV
ncbi:30S ribosomal protein S2 (chloroplast) [Aureococcus anophagefferens]|jgi:small subunit ribosomal protein S2|uniref:Small ribosomal subunit protein uS2c n=2 Tax=Aureococcus anophagefferens TaxID=44056 RepID=C6KIJ0_AURAN|nr:30S ribosomal protein S2 [Aureococcus anophagefferens]ACS36796.1 30S ribosomal protein S2 [Aureococcus anophagefferens]KAH8042967.1 30S ribosomal protein S2 [Aureococcus anophagefferens]KAH8043066.1 30S ribosomal protein S2 [Aureococcus anophagefferens]KAH8043269.1 30S ribosomal protein S2 [Aureococcus anophagefferens]|tara:strand:- start:1198 stop:1878 length:681 start_codon:yes stop_codon:yes gene_type:complete